MKKRVGMNSDDNGDWPQDLKSAIIGKSKENDVWAETHAVWSAVDLWRKPHWNKNNVIRAETISILTESSIDRKVPASQKDLQLKLILISLSWIFSFYAKHEKKIIIERLINEENNHHLQP